MIVIKPVLIVCFVGLFVWAFRNRSRVGIRAGIKVVAVGLTGFAIAAIVHPGLTLALAHFVGVASGTDLLLYALVVVFAFTMVAGYFRYRDLESRLAEIVRAQAISEEIHSTGMPGADHPRDGHPR